MMKFLFEQASKVAKNYYQPPACSQRIHTKKTVMEMIDAFNISRDKEDVGVIILTGAGDQAFCSGGDQKVRGNGGYVGEDNIPRLNVLDFTTVNPCHSQTSHRNGERLVHWRRQCFTISL